MREIKCSFNHGEFILTENCELFRCDKENRLIKQVYPYLDNEFLELYVLPWSQGITYLMVGISNGKRQILRHSLKGATESREYMLLGKDYAYARSIYGPFGQIKSWSIWVCSTTGEYEDITQKLLKGSCICTHIEKSGAVYKLFCQRFRSGEKVFYMVKKNGTYQLIDKIDADKLMKQPLKVKRLSGWRTFSEMELEDISFIYED